MLYDAVVIIPGEGTETDLSSHPEAQNFVRDAFNHQKFIAYTDAASPLLVRAGINDSLDAGCMNLSNDGTAEQFIASCRQVRFWDRMPS